MWKALRQKVSLTATQFFPIATAGKPRDSSPVQLSQNLNEELLFWQRQRLGFNYSCIFLYESGPWEHLWWKRLLCAGHRIYGQPCRYSLCLSKLQVPLQGHRFNLCSHTSVRGQPLKQAETLIHLFAAGAYTHQWSIKQLRSNLGHQTFASGNAVSHCPFFSLSVRLWVTSTKLLWNLACSFYDPPTLHFLRNFCSLFFLQLICSNVTLFSVKNIPPNTCLSIT